jgi:hypothetical protein
VLGTPSLPAGRRSVRAHPGGVKHGTFPIEEAGGGRHHAARLPRSLSLALLIMVRVAVSERPIAAAISAPG